MVTIIVTCVSVRTPKARPIVACLFRAAAPFNHGNGWRSKRFGRLVPLGVATFSMSAIAVQ
jgi:hypothetical protein